MVGDISRDRIVDTVIRGIAEGRVQRFLQRQHVTIRVPFARTAGGIRHIRHIVRHRPFREHPRTGKRLNHVEIPRVEERAQVSVFLANRTLYGVSERPDIERHTITFAMIERCKHPFARYHTESLPPVLMLATYDAIRRAELLGFPTKARLNERADRCHDVHCADERHERLCNDCTRTRDLTAADHLDERNNAA